MVFQHLFLTSVDGDYFGLGGEVLPVTQTKIANSAWKLFLIGDHKLYLGKRKTCEDDNIRLGNGLFSVLAHLDW
jgi:hypothetical protein